MTVSTVKRPAKSAYWAGFRDGAPFVLVAVPFALVFGVIAVDAGLTLAQALGFSVLVIAGASQFAAVQLMVENASIAFVLLAALAVNLRMAMYSASLLPHLGAAPMWQRALVSYLNFDQSYLVSLARFEARPDMPLQERVAYFLGTATPIAPLWVVATFVGVLAGSAIPEAWALDFIMPIMFLALMSPMLKSPAHVAAAAVSVSVGIALAGLPAGTGLLAAAGAAMLTGALVEVWIEGRRG